MKEEILKKLNSEDKNEVREAILSLAGEPDPNIARAVIEAVINSKSKAVLEAGKSFFLSYKGDTEVLCNEIIKFFNYPEPKLRQTAIDILSSKGETCIDVIEKNLVQHKDYNMRKFALDILANVRTRRALSLIEKLINDENQNVRMSALEYLRNFSDFKDEVINIIYKLIPNIKDTYEFTTLASTVIYGELKDKKLAEPIREKLKATTDPLNKYWLYKILIFLGEKDIYEEAISNGELIGMREDVEKDIRIFNS